jgi:hypothetical protein
VVGPRRTAAWARWLALLAVLGAGSSARAEVGTGHFALPAADQVLVPTTHAAPLSLAGSAGYAVTESQAGEGVHQRVEGSLAAGFGLTPNIAFSIGMDGRYDHHAAGDSGALGTPRLILAAGYAVNEKLHVGGALTLVLPGRNAPSLDFGAAALALTGLASWQLSESWVLAAQLGYRLDESAAAARGEGRLSPADRLSLGASAFDSLPLGLAAFEQIGPLELVYELSCDALVGKGAPSLGYSPLRAAVAARLPFIAGVSGELMLRASLSRRPDYDRTEPLLPVEPRFAIGVGLRFVPDFTPHVPKVVPRTITPTTQLTGVVIDPEGTRVAAAQVSLRTGDDVRTIRSADDGSYALLALPRGLAEISIEGVGLVKITQTIALDRANVELPLRVARREEHTQLRGLVRSFAGRPLAAKVRVSSADESVTADKDGRFVLELRPGNYEVDIECDGYLTQRRRVSVQENGVTLLNVELHAAER